MNLVIWLLVLFFGKLEGMDAFGNKFYSLKLRKIPRVKRCVLFKGIAEPSKISPMHDLWLRHVIDVFPNNTKCFKWQKDKLPNLTGTKFAFSPHVDCKKIVSYNDYSAWEEK